MQGLHTLGYSEGATLHAFVQDMEFDSNLPKTTTYNIRKPARHMGAVLRTTKLWVDR